jgi:superfamily II DNA or RNA helicase
MTDEANQIEQVIIDLKNEIHHKANRLKYMKFRTFLSQIGYQNERRSGIRTLFRPRNSKRGLLDSVDQYVKKHGMVVYVHGAEMEDWLDLRQEDTITFRLREDPQRVQGKTEHDFAGTISVSNDSNPVNLFPHQSEAIKALDEKIIKAHPTTFAGLLVIPTGGGKTLTAVHWLLRNVVDQQQKVLWLAHRHELLNQALFTVQRNAYANLLRNRKQFRYRILSGQHDKPVHIQSNDDILIASKDSIHHGMQYVLDQWLKPDEQVFLVIDEAHHATAKTYRKIIDDLRANRPHFRMLGLTATPFRTSPSEQGLLKKIFEDDIVYKIDLEKLIVRGILSKPIFRELSTHFDLSEEINDEDVKRIKMFDLPDDIAESIAQSKERNNFIVEHYVEHQKEYGQLLVFALTIDHAITLNTLFSSRGIASAYVVSSIRDAFTQVTRSPEENKENIKRFKEGTIQVLINVEILTEGTDLPNVQTVFLTRPTISSILMTQMIGRALRGEKAGGTEKAYIVSFIDDWKDKIAWVNPERLYIEEEADFTDSTTESKQQFVRLVSIEKMEEFARMMDSSIDTMALESVDFIERVPIGLYSFSIDEKLVSKNCDILIYDCMKEAYQNFISDLAVIFEQTELQGEEYLDDELLDALTDQIKHEYFDGYEMLPNYRDEDIKNILRYYALKGIEPTFLAFQERSQLDLTAIARHIYDHSLGGQARKEYIDSIWNEETSFWKVYFGNEKRYFMEQLDLEYRKIEDPELYFHPISHPKIEADMIDWEKLTLHELHEKNPSYWRAIRDAVYENAKDENGLYTCAISGFKSARQGYFEIDHILPMSKGGLTEPSNLQLLRRRENRLKGDK